MHIGFSFVSCEYRFTGRDIQIRGRVIMPHKCALQSQVLSSRSRNMNRASVGRAGDTLVEENAKACLEQLGEVSLRLQKNKEGLSKEDIELFRTEIATVLKAAITSKFVHLKTCAAIESVLGQRKEGTDPEEAKRSIKQKIEEACSDFDATKDTDYVRITSMLKSEDDDIDEDFVMIDRGLTENDIKCQYTSQIFKEPMKNVGGPGLAPCIHHVSREALDAMCRTAKHAKCPIGGCKGMWSKATAVHDLEFERKVKKFVDSKNVAQQAGVSQSAQSAEDYTQL